jgi:tetratricopeptide (TPR) repeat protein
MSAGLTSAGSTVEAQGRLQEALEYFQRARALREAVGEDSLTAGSLINIADVLDEQGKLEEADALYRQALTLREEAGDPAGVARACYAMARSLWRRGQRADAIPWTERAMTLYRDESMFPEAIRELERLASIFQEMGDKPRAEQYRKDASALRAQQG